MADKYTYFFISGNSVEIKYVNKKLLSCLQLSLIEMQMLSIFCHTANIVLSIRLCFVVAFCNCFRVVFQAF
jgi:hypothetical protein